MTPTDDDRSDALASREAVRARSKLLLGGWYRAEVARAISDLADRQWTLFDLEQRVPDVSRSCVNKELATLLKCELVVRRGKNDRGQYLHATAGYPEYWAIARAITERPAPRASHAQVVAMRSHRGEGPSSRPV